MLKVLPSLASIISQVNINFYTYKYNLYIYSNIYKYVKVPEINIKLSVVNNTVISFF